MGGKTNKLKKKILRKCRGLTLCLCQFKDKLFDSGNKHKCISYKKHKTLQPKYKMSSLMDEFMSKPLRMAMHNKGSPLHLQFQYHPSILHLHILGKYPFFNRKHHLHRYKIPWFRYKQYAHLRPNQRPKWCPRWIWREIEGHVKRPRGLKHHKASAAHFDEYDYYNYDGQAIDNLDDENEGDDNFFDDELPFITPLIQSASHLLPGLLENARKTLPKLLRKSVRRGGFIHNALDGRGGMENYGTMGGFGGGKIKSLFKSDKNSKRKKEKMMAKFGLRRRMKYYDDDLYDDEEDEDLDDDDFDEYENLNYREYDDMDFEEDDDEYDDLYYDQYDDDEYEEYDEYNDYDYDQYDDMEAYDGEYYDDDENIMDAWFDDEMKINWVIMADDYSDIDQIQNIEDMKWDIVHKNIIANSGKKVQKRCMNVFGKQLCLCQFLDFIGAESVNHLCYPIETKMANKKLTKKLAKKKQMKLHQQLIKMEKQSNAKMKKVMKPKEEDRIINGRPLGPMTMKKIAIADKERKKEILHKQQKKKKNKS